MVGEMVSVGGFCPVVALLKLLLLPSFFALFIFGGFVAGDGGGLPRTAVAIVRYSALSCLTLTCFGRALTICSGRRTKNVLLRTVHAFPNPSFVYEGT